MSDAYGEAVAARAAAAQPKRATAADHDVVVRLLVRAFADDPVMTWWLRDNRRTAALEGFMRFAMSDQIAPHDAVFAAPDFKAVAAWLPPSGLGSLSLSTWRTMLLLPRMLAMTGWSRLPRATAMSRAMEQHHPSSPHWYLYFIGVEPALRGHGLGSAILEASLRSVDAERMPAYLDNSNPRNTRLYERQGFRVVSEFHARADAPPLWGMWRDART